MQRPIPIVFISALLALLPLSAAAGEEIQFTSRIDWRENTFIIEAQIDLSKQDSFIPLARSQSEQLVEQRLPITFRQTLAALVVDSYYTAGEMAADSPELVRAINNLTYKNTKTFSHISNDLQRFSVTYSYRFYPDIIDIFTFHQRPYNPPRVLSYVPTTAFTGIVIYMMDNFPVHGEQGTKTELQPCLFPKIYDEQMNLIYEKGMVDPDILREWGMVAYTDTLDISRFIERVGDSPLRILGRGIFGKNHSDIIIDTETARKILFHPENRKLLTEGKVLVICGLPE